MKDELTTGGQMRFSSVLERNIEALLQHRDELEQRRTKQERS
jgi:hypothetical protein